ncbi:MAG: hypothetical protein OEW92_08280 [Gammaproteobacteria bacterium]|nr:hypothetical protein [Gammaproteobacteria bacterium]MDH5172399.1 hypothetical protein [Gammaproteobacteria bacterium]
MSPHLGNSGACNSAQLGELKGIPMLFARRDSVALALACPAGWLQRSVAFVGVSDGWQDLSRHRRMTWSHERADDDST